MKHSSNAPPHCKPQTANRNGTRKQRTRAAKQQRRDREKDLHFEITPHPHSLRTLKRSVRKQLERDRAPGLWIYPWLLGPSRQHQERQYPPKSLLGLPAEIRQKILYECYTIRDLEADIRGWTREEDGRDVTWRGTGRTIKLRRIDQNANQHTPNRVELTPREAELIILLGRRVAQISRVAPLVRSDMLYVSALWQQDLQHHVERKLHTARLHGSNLPVVVAGYEWLSDTKTKRQAWNGKKGVQIKTKARLGGRKIRPQKCWFCTERHRDRDPVCPLERREPERWEKMTKKVGGKRGELRDGRDLKGKKIVFRD